jgi:hypothetical protein
MKAAAALWVKYFEFEMDGDRRMPDVVISPASARPKG